MFYILKTSFTGVVVLRKPLCTNEVKSCYVSYNCNLCLFFLIFLVGWLLLLFSRISQPFQLIFVWVKWIPSFAAREKWNWRRKKNTSYALSPQKCEVYKVCINKSNRLFATVRGVKYPRRWWQRELKKKGLISKTATLLEHAAKFSLQLFLGRHCDYNVKLHSVRFHRGRLNNKNK